MKLQDLSLLEVRLNKPKRKRGESISVSMHPNGDKNITLTKHGKKLADSGKLDHKKLEKEFGGKLSDSTIQILTNFGWRKIYKGKI
jgi:hypothetical protein